MDKKLTSLTGDFDDVTQFRMQRQLTDLLQGRRFFRRVKTSVQNLTL